MCTGRIGKRVCRCVCGSARQTLVRCEGLASRSNQESLQQRTMDMQGPEHSHVTSARASCVGAGTFRQEHVSVPPSWQRTHVSLKGHTTTLTSATRMGGQSSQKRKIRTHKYAWMVMLLFKKRVRDQGCTRRIVDAKWAQRTLNGRGNETQGT